MNREDTISDLEDAEELQGVQRFSFSCCCDLQFSPPTYSSSSPPPPPPPPASSSSSSSSSSSGTATVATFDYQHNHHVNIDHDDHNDDDDDDDDESYIEIAIEHTQLPASLSDHKMEKKKSEKEDDDDLEDEEDLEFRISFSSACLFPDFQGNSPRVLFTPHRKTTLKATLDPTVADHCSSSLLFSSTSNVTFIGSISATTCPSPATRTEEPLLSNGCDYPNKSNNTNSSSYSDDNGEIEKTSSSSRRRMQFPEEVVVHHFNNTLPSLSCLMPYSSSSSPSSEEAERISEYRQSPQFSFQQGAAPGFHKWKLLRSRKVTKMKTAINGGITRLFIKFRSIKIRSVLSSYMNKSQREGVGDLRRIFEEKSSPYEDEGERAMKVVKPFNRCTSIQMTDDHKIHIRGTSFGFGLGCGNTRSITNHHRYQKSRIEVDDMKLDDRKVKELMNSQSCPSSIKCSPIHIHNHNHSKESDKSVANNRKMYTIQENSVEGAIAYCKRSFCPEPPPHDDFHFHAPPHFTT